MMVTTHSGGGVDHNDGNIDCGDGGGSDDDNDDDGW